MKRFFVFCLLMTAVFGWQRVFDFSTYGSFADEGIEMPDSSVVLVVVPLGMPDSTDNGLIVMMIDEKGDSVWTRQFGWFVSPNRAKGSVAKYDDSTFVVAGMIENHSTSFVFTLMRMNLNGDVLWSHIDTTNHYSYGENTERDHTGNIISQSYNWSVSFTETGDFIDYRSIGTSDTTFDSDLNFDMKTVKFPPYGSVIVGQGVGRVPIHDRNNGYIIYLDTEHEEVWNYNYGATGLTTVDHDQLRAVEVVSNPSDGNPRGFIAAGCIFDPADSTHHGYIVRTDMEGEIIWQREFGPSPQGMFCYEFYDIAWTQREETQTQFAVVGNRYRHRVSSSQEAYMCIISDTLDGDTLWSNTYEVGGVETTRDNFWAVISCQNGDFLMSGICETASIYAPDNMWLLRTDSIGNDVPYAIAEPQVPAAPLPEQLEVMVFPNPFNSTVEIRVTVPDGTNNVSVTIYDITGKMIKELTGNEGNTFRWDGTDQKGNSCPTGAYLYRATCGDNTVTDNILYVK